MGTHLLAVVAEGSRGRVYLSPPQTEFGFAGLISQVGLPGGGSGLCVNEFGGGAVWEGEAEKSEGMEVQSSFLEQKLSGKAGDSVPLYGLKTYADLFTDRQLVALTTFSDLLGEVRGQVIADAESAGLSDDGVRLRDGGAGAVAYADAVVTYLAFVVDKCAEYWSSACTWINTLEAIRSTFARQAIAMNWDYAEVNPFSSSTGNWMAMVNWVSKAVVNLPATGHSGVCQKDARAKVRQSSGAIISTDPPYYDNICYADISDFFYVWMKRNLADVWPGECSTLLTPKSEELIANIHRFASKKDAEEYFELGMAEFMIEVAATQHPDVPATIYYAYKATETSDAGKVLSTGWDTFLQGVVDAGLHVTATWPLRTERSARPNAVGSNALASSIVLACRPRPQSAPLATRSEFVAALRSELPGAVELLQSGNIAPVDLPQSTIGPGISVFSRYARVVEADGERMPVREALAVINEVLDEVLHEEESELDAETRFALAWYAQHGFEAALYGEAESVAKAKNTAVEGVEKAEIGEGSAGRFRLRARSELCPDWDPAKDTRLTAWEALQHLAARLERSESLAADLLARLGTTADGARQLAYLLHKIASDNRWAEEALVYNNLIAVWPILRSKPQLRLTTE